MRSLLHLLSAASIVADGILKNYSNPENPWILLKLTKQEIDSAAKTIDEFLN